MSPALPRFRRALFPILPAALFAASATLAFGHPGHGPADGFSAGLAHPLSGWDHLLALLAVGIWAAQLGAPWLFPGLFLGALSVGAVAGHFLGPISGIEQAIAASVLILGLLVARSVRLPRPAAGALVLTFALFHGLAHGAEMPATAGGLAYGAGFLAASAALQAAGVALGTWAARRSARLPQLAGWAIAAAGMAIVLI